MRLKLKMAVRDWDYLTPLALGDVKPDRLELEIHRLDTLPDWSRDSDYDAGEVSFSQYVQARVAGGHALRCLPHFMMRGFRHRCMLASSESEITRLDELAGKRVGVTGWPDSGNTWTRALLRRAGIGIDDVHWFAGRLTAAHPVMDRLGRHARPGQIDAAPGERPLTELLQAGQLDAVFTPFLPPEFFDDRSALRFLLPDFRGEELLYYQQVGYVPGIHLLGIRPQMCDEHPWLAGALGEAIEEAARVWMNKRTKYADTTPWLIDDIARTKRDLLPQWNANGFSNNEKMIDDFAAEMFEQRVVDKRLTAKDLFRH